MKLNQFLAAATCASLFANVAHSEEAVTAETVLVTVNGTEISIGHIISMTASLPDQYQQLPDDVLFKAVLDQLIQQIVIGKEADKNSLKIKTAIENETRAVLAGNVLDKIAEEATADEKLKIAFEEEYVNGPAKTEYRASHILVNTEVEAKDIVFALDDGADFAALAKEKSTGPSGPKGGDLGWFVKERMVPEFGATVALMIPETISDPVQTKFGWHVIKLFETREAAKPSFDSVRDEIEEQLSVEATNAAIVRLESTAKILRIEIEIEPSIIRRTQLLD